MPSKLLTLITTLAMLGQSASMAIAQTPNADADKRLAQFAALKTEILTANAPAPHNLPQDMKLTLIDFIDCSTDRLHPFFSDGHDTVAGNNSTANATGQVPATYRQTGAHAGSYFAWRLRVAEAVQPHLLVLEFPDNADRMTAISLSQPPTSDADAPESDTPMKLEFGYRTGDLLPLSKGMVTSSLVFYPTSGSPPALLVANWHAHQPAALARVWVYTIDEPLPPAFAPDVSLHRQAGRFDDLPTSLQQRYGGRVENLISQMDWLGLGELALVAMDHRHLYYPSEVFSGGRGTLPKVLASLEPTGKRLIAVFDPDCTTGVYTMPGQDRNLAHMGDARVRTAWTDFIVKDFVEPLKDSPALGGVMFGGPRGSVGTDLEAGAGYNQFITQLSGTIEKQHPSLSVYQNLGPATQHDHYLRHVGGFGIIQQWTAGRADMDDALQERVTDYFRRYGLSNRMGGAGTTILRGSEIDDAAYYRFYRSSEPRYWMLDAISSSSRISQTLLSGGHLNGILLNHLPQWRLLHLQAGRDFWWDYGEMAPHIVPVGRHLLAPLTLALATDAEPFVIWFGGQGAQTSLNDGILRHWLRTFRRLPFRHMAPVEGADVYPVAVRHYSLNGLHVLLANQSPSEATITLELNSPADGEFLSTGQLISGQSIKLTLPPYGIEGLLLTTDELEIIAVEQSAPALAGMMNERLREFQRNMQAAADAGLEMEERFATTLAAARKAIESADLALAETLLQASIIREPALRVRLATARPRADVHRQPGKITIDGRLDDWAGMQPIHINQAHQLVADAFVANRWRGPQDLSAELYLAWSDEGLYFALKIQDDQPTDDENEMSMLAWSRGQYKSHVVRNDYDGMLQMHRTNNESPHLVTRRQDSVTIHEGLIPANQLSESGSMQAGLVLGLNVVISDSDDRRGMSFTWGKSSMLAWSTLQDGYDVLSDAQTCGEIELK